MRPATLKQPALCLALGAVLAVAVTWLLAATMAIAAPAGFFAWFKSHGALDLGLAIWTLLVAYLPAMGIPAFMVLSAVFRFGRATVASAVSFVAGVLLVMYLAYPLAEGWSFSLAFQRPWWGYGLELSLFAGAAAALLLARGRAGGSPSPGPVPGLA